MSYEAQTLFYQGAYEGCIAAAGPAASKNNSNLDDPQSRASLLYAARAHLALNKPEAALAILPTPTEQHRDITAVHTLASFSQKQQAAGAVGADDADDDYAVEALHTLSELLEEAEEAGDESDTVQTIRICNATVMFKDGDALGALETLAPASAQQQIEAVALSVHILLSIHRPDLAQREYEAARSWADDSLLIQLIEAWLGLSTGGRAAQQAYYVYDELAQNPGMAGSKNLVSVLIGKAAALAIQAKYAEADKVLADAATLDPSSPHVLANRAALAGHLSSGRSSDTAKEYLDQLRAVDPSHRLISDVDDKTQLFEKIAASIAAFP
ncbi:hypothetical protein OC846_004239 [Tilletia horrida]|uniref:Coatomer subunit epsilon n=1 Tax=Tilletia horrida TaxID=155126 RepID=A0AAN6JR02_9BASI|nr:hypothetical protein OC846_004239 [Tilletia horrida]KAK0568929.1 hypothetical protein OC861_001456 [Tilletia horrida]